MAATNRDLRRFSHVLVTVGATILLYVCFCIWWYGGIKSAYLSWIGAPIEINVAGIDHELLPGKKFISNPIHVRNHGLKPVTLVGSSSSCSCTGVVGLPVTLGAGESKTLEAVVTPPQDSKDESRSFTVSVLTDLQSQPRLNFKVTLK